MKTIKFMLIALFAIAMTNISIAQNASVKTETIKVSGECELCKEKIEKAAKTAGAQKAIWNQDSKMLTIVYDQKKVKSDDVQKKIASVGYDTPKFKATDAVYKALPGCCRYR